MAVCPEMSFMGSLKLIGYVKFHHKEGVYLIYNKFLLLGFCGPVKLHSEEKKLISKGCGPP